MASYLLNAPDDQMERWKAAAKERGYTLAEFIRGCIEAELADSSVLRRTSPTRALEEEVRASPPATVPIPPAPPGPPPPAAAARPFRSDFKDPPKPKEKKR